VRRSSSAKQGIRVNYDLSWTDSRLASLARPSASAPTKPTKRIDLAEAAIAAVVPRWQSFASGGQLPRM